MSTEADGADRSGVGNRTAPKLAAPAARRFLRLSSRFHRFIDVIRLHFIGGRMAGTIDHLLVLTTQSAEGVDASAHPIPANPDCGTCRRIPYASSGFQFPGGGSSHCWIGCSAAHTFPLVPQRGCHGLSRGSFDVLLRRQAGWCGPVAVVTRLWALQTSPAPTVQLLSNPAS